MRDCAIMMLRQTRHEDKGRRLFIERMILMVKSRKDSKGRKLRDGENQRSDGRYCFRFTDSRTRKRRTIYAKDLAELREKEKEIAKDIEDNILTGSEIKNMTINMLFETYINTRELAQSTRKNYENTWNNRVKDEIGNIKVVQILPSHIKAFYAKLSKAGYSHSTIKVIHNMLYPALEMAVDDDILRKNPAKNVLGDYGRAPEKRTALTSLQQERMLKFVQSHNIYNSYYPMLQVLFGTGLRCGELIGVTWNDVDMKAGTVSIDHQLIYKNYGDGCKFHISTPKTEAGIRTIPMTQAVRKAFEEQRKINFMLGKDRDIEVEGYKGFVFTAKTGSPLMPAGVNSALYNIIDAYNKAEVITAKKEHRKAELLPKISAHICRHTACTRMAEAGVEPKTLQYLMGHENIEITMQVYNHVDMLRVEKEMAKMDVGVANF